HEYGHLLYDLQEDYGQEHPLQDEAQEARMIDLMVRLMQASDAPQEQFQRLGLQPALERQSA
ncbi:MAG: sulfatase, partial [Caldilineae bacterium]